MGTEQPAQGAPDSPRRRASMNLSLRTKQIVIALAAAGIGAGSALALQTWDATPALTQPPAAAAPPMQLPDIATLVERSTPAVVHITVSGKTPEGAAEALPDLGEDGPFGEFFKRFPFPRDLPGPDSAP